MHSSLETIANAIGHKFWKNAVVLTSLLMNLLLVLLWHLLLFLLIILYLCYSCLDIYKHSYSITSSVTVGPAAAFTVILIIC